MSVLETFNKKITEAPKVLQGALLTTVAAVGINLATAPEAQAQEMCTVTDANGVPVIDPATGETVPPVPCDDDGGTPSTPGTGGTVIGTNNNTNTNQNQVTGGDATANATGGNAHNAGNTLNNHSTYRGAAAMNLGAVSFGVSHSAAATAANVCADSGWGFNLGGGNVSAGYGGFGFGSSGDGLVDLTVHVLDENGDKKKDANGDYIMATYTTADLAELEPEPRGVVFRQLGGEEDRSKAICLVNEYNKAELAYEKQERIAKINGKVVIAQEKIRQQGADSVANRYATAHVEGIRVEQQGETARASLRHLCNESVAFEERVLYQTSLKEVEKRDPKTNAVLKDANGDVIKEWKKVTTPLLDKDGKVQTYRVAIDDTIASHKRSENGSIPASGKPDISEHGACAKAAFDTVKALITVPAATSAPAVIGSDVNTDFLNLDLN